MTTQKQIQDTTTNSYIISEMFKIELQRALNKKQELNAQDILNGLGDLRIK